jgi:formylglycine-generating enzyme required for sulfatase activity
MSSSAELAELVGFFSYSREDDTDSQGALSALRSRIQGELRGQLGRSAKTFRLWQDKEAIPSGTLWETEIKNAVAQSVFFIPIITPTALASPNCRFELESFLAREAALGRNDLVFPILYIDVPALEDSGRRQNDPVLSLIAKRQYADWRKLRHHDVHTTDFSEAVEQFCRDIRDALRRYWLTVEEGKAKEEATALQKTEAERKRQEAEAKHRDEEEAQRNRQAGVEKQAAEAEWRRAEGQRLYKEAEAKRRAEAEERRRLRRLQARALWPPPRSVLAGGALVVVLLGAVAAWLALSATPMPVTPASPLRQAANAPLSEAQERALKPREAFQECANCPQMLVVPAGTFTMGSPSTEPGRSDHEGPQHAVTIARQFAVGQFELTFEEWDSCASTGGCNGYKPSDQSWGRGTRPAINVSWNDAKAYVAWLAKKTGKPYRLLTEAEYEYAARAGTTSAYPWGSVIGISKANCNNCGSRWDNKQTAPVGSFAANSFGLYDMVGNVWEWTEDCWHDSYNDASAEGTAWINGDCSLRVLRGGSWVNKPESLRSAARGRLTTDYPDSGIGFRVARMLLTP